MRKTLPAWPLDTIWRWKVCWTFWGYIGGACTWFLGEFVRILDCCLYLQPRQFKKRKCPFCDSELIELKRLKRRAETSFRRLKTVQLREIFRQRNLIYFQVFRKKRSLFIADAMSLRALSQLLGEPSSVLPILFGSDNELADILNWKKKNQTLKGVLESCLDLGIEWDSLSGSFTAFQVVNVAQLTILALNTSSARSSNDIFIPSQIKTKFWVVSEHLCSIVNKSLSTAAFPNCLKTAVVLLHWKKSNLYSESLNKYRPLSIIFFPMRWKEWLMPNV